MPPEAAIFFEMSKTQNFLELGGEGLAWELLKNVYRWRVCEGVRGGRFWPMGNPPPPTPHCQRGMSMKPYTPNLRKNITLLEDFLLQTQF